MSLTACTVLDGPFVFLQSQWASLGLHILSKLTESSLVILSALGTLAFLGVASLVLWACVGHNCLSNPSCAAGRSCPSLNPAETWEALSVKTKANKAFTFSIMSCVTAVVLVIMLF